MELTKLGEEKVALFAVIPDSDTSLNFLVNILYTQLFQELFRIADDKYKGQLPMPVHFVMDEFANVALPDDFQSILSVMRSRNIFVSIILQNLSQLKALYEKDWESITGNCDQTLYLGGNENSSQKYISEMLGKETIDNNTYGKTVGRNGSYSTNYQIMGRDLLSIDEVRMLDNNKCILMIRGEKPIMDYKYDILKHPNVKYTTDGKGKEYIHGRTDRATMQIGNIVNLEDEEYKNVEIVELDEIETKMELLSSQEIEQYFIKEELENENNKK